ncbi:MAG: RNA-binding S4 domain-containing protein [Burkholderiaceae bacterium]|nr:RNA-binding S4 domain-containing protein [Burkholderiaceae bacterium]
MQEDSTESIRLDKWLWAARFFKTRTLAQDNIELGRVRIDNQRVKPSKEIRCGDEIEVNRGQERFIVVVKKISSKRGSASIAQQLYEETQESLEMRERIRNNLRAVPIVDYYAKGRPTKRDGRKLREFMAQHADYDPTKEF